MDEHTLLSPWPARDVHHLPGFHNIRCAVLVPIVKADGELHLLYEVRSAELKWQPCDISFPGGKIEAGDMSPQAAAVREAMEELYLKKNTYRFSGPWITSNPLRALRSILLRPDLTWCRTCAVRPKWSIFLRYPLSGSRKIRRSRRKWTWLPGRALTSRQTSPFRAIPWNGGRARPVSFTSIATAITVFGA